MVMNNDLQAAGSVASLVLPHIIFFLYKIGQSVFSPTTKLYLYASVCSDRYGDEPFHVRASGTVTAAAQYKNKGHYPSQSGYNFSTPVSSLFVGPTQIPSANAVSLRNITSCSDLSGPQEDLIQMEAADYIMAMKILQDVPAFILGLFCGGWSDRVGRRLPMMLPCIGGLLVSLLFVCIQAGGGVAIPGILFGVTVNSFCGRNTLVSMAVQAYVTDQTSEHERTRQLGRILAMNFFGLFAGSFIMALLADLVSFWVVFLCVAFFYSIALALIYFLLPESKLPGSHHGIQSRQGVSMSSSNSFHHRDASKVPLQDEDMQEPTLISKLMSCFRVTNFTDTLSTITRQRPQNMRRYLIVGYICIVLHNSCKSGEIDILLLFVKHTPLNWSKSWYGYLLSFQYANVGLFLIFILPLLLNKLQLSDSSIIIGCVLTKAFGLTLLAFSDRTWMVFMSNIFVSTFGMIISCLRSIVSKMVDEDETGRCFAIISSSETVSDLVGVIFFTRLYYIGLSYPNGRPLPFIVMATLHIILLFLAIYIKFGLKKLTGEGAANAGRYDQLVEDTPEHEASEARSAYAMTRQRSSAQSSFAQDDYEAPLQYDQTTKMSYGATATDNANYY